MYVYVFFWDEHISLRDPFFSPSSIMEGQVGQQETPNIVGDIPLTFHFIPTRYPYHAPSKQKLAIDNPTFSLMMFPLKPPLRSEISQTATFDDTAADGSLNPKVYPW